MSRNVTYGFEFEIANKDDDEIAYALRSIGYEVWAEGYTHDKCTVWKAVRDGSCGYELVTPILTRETYGGYVNKALKAVKDIGAKIDRHCGFHVHIGAKYDNGDVFIQNLDLLYHNWYAVHSATNGLVTDSRISNRYAEPLSADTVQRRIDYGLYDWINNHEWRDEARYCSLNILPIAKYPTVEFRLHQGTLNDTKAIAWANYCEAFIHISNDGINLSEVLPSIRQFEGQRKDYISNAEAIVLINYMIENGYLSSSAGNYLIMNSKKRVR